MSASPSPVRARLLRKSNGVEATVVWDSQQEPYEESRELPSGTSIFVLEGEETDKPEMVKRVYDKAKELGLRVRGSVSRWLPATM